MSSTQNANTFIVPPTPSLSRSCPDVSHIDSQTELQTSVYAASDTTDSGRSSKKLVEDPFYRTWNLAANNIYMRSPQEEFPDRISKLVDLVHKDRDSPSPSSDQLRLDSKLITLEMGAGEPQVEEYFRNNLFPDPELTECLKRADKQWMSKHGVPNTGSKYKVSTSVPDMLYGYSNEAFLQQQAQLFSMGPEMTANNQGLIYPFFVIEFKGDGPTGAGSMWVAMNQCLGGSASCVNIAERLNHRLRQYKSDKIQPSDSVAFSVAMNGTEARLYISWKHNELDYYMQKIDSFLLQKPMDYMQFHNLRAEAESYIKISYSSL